MKWASLDVIDMNTYPISQSRVHDSDDDTISDIVTDSDNDKLSDPESLSSIDPTTTTTDRKIHHIRDGIYFGSIDAYVDFQKAGINVVINLASEIENDSSSNLLWHKCGIDNDEMSGFPSETESMLSAIRAYRDVNIKCCLCCDTGLTRAPAMGVYYLMMYENMTFQEAFEIIHACQPEIFFTMGLMQELEVIDSALMHYQD